MKITKLEFNPFFCSGEKERSEKMGNGKSRMVHVLEFGCQAPLKFYMHCSACPQSEEDCTDLMLGKEILGGKKKLVYNGTDYVEGSVHASSFNCTAPLQYFEKSKKKCGHMGRCREEGLLLALLSGKRGLDYSQKTTIELPRKKSPQKVEESQTVVAAS